MGAVWRQPEIYRDLVVDVRLAVVGEWLVARRFVVVFFPAFVATDGGVVLDDTRVECFVRCLIAFLGAASAIEPRMNTATSAASSIFIVLRIIESPLFLTFLLKPDPMLKLTVVHPFWLGEMVSCALFYFRPTGVAAAFTETAH